MSPMRAAIAFVDNVLVSLKSLYISSAEIDGTIKDITTLCSTQLAGYCIRAPENIDVLGIWVETAASSYGSTDTQVTTRMDKRTADVSGYLLLVHSAGCNIADVFFWKRT